MAQRLDLPFTGRRRDVGSAVWRHRAGIYAVLALIFVVAAVFIGSKIYVKIPEKTDGILIDLRTIEELQREAQRLENEVRMRQLNRDPDAFARNITSNQAAAFQDVDNTRAAADRNINSALQANRDAYNEGMQQIADMRSAGGEKNDTTLANDTRAKGRVLVSFHIVSPTRMSDFLEVPGYRCEGGGEVVVDVVVDASGSVVSTAVNRALSTTDGCMHTSALTAARRSRFRPDASAPQRQSGTITYSFIPQ